MIDFFHFSKENPCCHADSRLILLLKSIHCPTSNNVTLYPIVLYNYEQIFQPKWPRKLHNYKYDLFNLSSFPFLSFPKLIAYISLV